MSAAVGAGKLLDNWWEGEQKPNYAISPLCRGRTPAFSGRFSPTLGRRHFRRRITLTLGQGTSSHPSEFRGLAGEMAQLAKCLPHTHENLNLEA